MRRILLYLLRLTTPRESPRNWGLVTKRGRAFRVNVRRDPANDQAVRQRAGRA